MLMKIRNKYNLVLMVIVCLLNWNHSTAQSATPQQIMENIYKAYDSLNYLSFDVKYTYTSDTVNGDFTHDILEGSYTIAGKKAKFNLGDIEFMQNDSFFITVYNDHKYILVADPRSANTGNELPMRQIIDSVINAYQQHYTYTNTNIGDSGILDFEKMDSAAQFVKFAITYDSVQNILHSIEYVFEESEPVDSLGYILPPVTREKRLKVEFSNYRFDNFSDSLYDENQYIFFEDGICKPIDKYNDFKIFYSRTGVIGSVETSGAQ
jgi:hypothetical protein